MLRGTSETRVWQEVKLNCHQRALEILEDALPLFMCFLGLGDFSKTSKRRFFPADFTFFFLVVSGINAPGAKSESESTSVV
jgi:hypothetical protein